MGTDNNALLSLQLSALDVDLSTSTIDEYV